MDFSLDADAETLQRSVLEFATKEFASSSAAARNATGFDQRGWDKCADFGLQALPITERYGGLGKDLGACAVALEALGRGCRDGGLLFSLCVQLGTGALPVMHYGTDAQKNRYLPGMAAGYLVGGHAMPEAGIDSSDARTAVRAIPTDAGYALRGVERFASNASCAHVFLVFASEPSGPASAENSDASEPLTAFLVARDTPGLTIGASHSAMGLGHSLIGELSFDDCQVPRSAVLGQPGAGMEIFAARFRWFLCCLLATTLGRMERQLHEAREYAQNRQQFGKPIGAFQTVAHRLADMKMRVEMARLLVHRLAWSEARNLVNRPGTDGWATSSGVLDADLFAAIGRLFIGQAYISSSRDAIQLHGGYGFMAEAGVASDLHDALGYHAIGGMADAQRDMIARMLGVGDSRLREP